VTALIVLSAVALIGVRGADVSRAQGSWLPVSITGAHVGEPGVNVGPDGAIYVNVPSGLGTGSPVFKSADGGATWALTPAGLRAALPGGGDANIALDPKSGTKSGTLYMADLWLGASTTSRSTDGASTWTGNPLGVPVQDRSWVATAGHGDVYMVTHQIPSGLVVSKSFAPLDGVAFPISTVGATPLDQEGCICPPGNIVAESGGLFGDKVGFIYATSTGAVHFARSTNGGLTFTNTVVTPDNPAAATNANFPVVADAGSGHLVAVWMEDFTNNDQVRIAQSTNFGASWSAPQTLVDNKTGTSVYPWVAVAGSKISVSLYHTSTVTTPDNAPAGTQWFETYLESIDGGSTFPAAPVTVDPTPVKTGPICTTGTTCSANRELLDFQTVTLDPSGRANISYARLSSGTVQTMFVRQS
jgi:hypothetical protein